MQHDHMRDTFWAKVKLYIALSSLYCRGGRSISSFALIEVSSYFGLEVLGQKGRRMDSLPGSVNTELDTKLLYSGLNSMLSD
jgi:hypothetical protein